jgi:hypothetical protein
MARLIPFDSSCALSSTHVNIRTIRAKGIHLAFLSRPNSFMDTKFFAEPSQINYRAQESDLYLIKDLFLERKQG